MLDYIILQNFTKYNSKAIQSFASLKLAVWIKLILETDIVFKANIFVKKLVIFASRETVLFSFVVNVL